MVDIMIRLYEKDEQNFISLGVGVLADCISCVVVEELNGRYELEMEYPLIGQHFKDITLGRIVFVKPNIYDDPQPFRIFEVTKPISGVVTIKAEHISYDMSGYTVRAFEADNLGDALSKIQNGSIIDHPFTFDTDKNTTIKMTTNHPYNMRSLLAGSNDSLLNVYGGEYKFDKFNVSLLNKRGEDRGVTIRYGKNMTDLEHETNSEKVFTGVFPFYFSINNETTTTTEKYYVGVHIVNNSVPITSGWFSLTINGAALIPIIEDVPVKVLTDGAYENEIYCFSTNVEKHGVELIAAKIVTSQEPPYSDTWLGLLLDDSGPLTLPKSGTINSGLEFTAERLSTATIYMGEVDGILDKVVDNGVAQGDYTWIDGGFDEYFLNVPIVNKQVIFQYAGASKNVIYDPEDIGPLDVRVVFSSLVPKTPLQKEYYNVTTLNKKYIWNGTNYIEYQVDGFYYIPDPIPEAPLSRPVTVTEERIEYVDLTTGIDTYIVSGSTPLSIGWLTKVQGASAFDPNKDPTNEIYIVKTPGEPYENKKYVWVEGDAEYVPFLDETGIIYIDKDAPVQRILTLDITPSVSEKPSASMVRTLAEAYISHNEIGEVKDITTVSFIKLADSPEYSMYSELEKVMLGDDVTIIYENLDVNVKLQVISTEFNVLTEKYNEIDLGKKSSNLVDNSISNGDSISALTNDVRYADYTTVNNLIAKVITADYIQASNAKLSTAQIDDLTVQRIRCAGIVEASRLDIDKVVSKLLMVDDAEITKTLTAGSIKVKGHIDALSGTIGGIHIEGGTLTIVRDNIKVAVDDILELTPPKINVVDLKAEEVKSKNFLFENTELKIEPIAAEGVDTQNVYVTSSSETQYFGFPENYTVFTFNLYSKDNIGDLLPVWEDIVASIRAKYTNPETSELRYIDIACTIKKNSSSGLKLSGAIGEVTDLVIDSVTIVPVHSDPITQTKAKPGVGFGFNSHIFPDNPDEVACYDIGASGLEWDNIYVGTVNESSDKNKKKDINYDISKYEQVFDKLKPASYKFIDGSSDRTHLGLIAQDIRDALEESDISSKDFAGYVRGVKPENKNKESLTEDDYIYAIRYSELHALQIYEIQKLKTYISSLETRIEELEKKKGE